MPAIAIAAIAAFSVDAMAQKTIKIGASAPKTGPLAGGSTVSFWPNVELWVKQINAAGGIKLKSGKAKIELIEYDDRTNPGEAIKISNALLLRIKSILSSRLMVQV